VLLPLLDAEESRIEKKLDTLLDLQLSAPEDGRVREKEVQLKRELDEVHARRTENQHSNDWLQVATKKFSLMAEVMEILNGDSLQGKNDLYHELGTNLTLHNKVLNVINAKEVQVFVDALKMARALNEGLEPRFNLVDKDETKVFTSVRPAWLRG